MTLEINHPMLDGADHGWAATELRSEVVGFTPDIADFLQHTITGQRPVIVTPEYARMTEALWRRLSEFNALWLVRIGKDEFYNGKTGALSTSVGEALRVEATVENVTPKFSAQPLLTRQHLAFSVITNHRDTQRVSLGGVAEVLANTSENPEPLRWGASEPATAPWDRDELTKLTRNRGSKLSSWVITGGKPAGVVGTVEPTRTDDGVEEATNISIDIGAPGEQLNEQVALTAYEKLKEGAVYGTPLIGVAFSRTTGSDACRFPIAQVPPEPLVLLLGPHLVSRLQIHPSEWVSEFYAAQVGDPRQPGVVFMLGHGAESRRTIDRILTKPAEGVVAEVLNSDPKISAILQETGV